jgi:hypothetical protein
MCFARVSFSIAQGRPTCRRADRAIHLIRDHSVRRSTSSRAGRRLVAQKSRYPDRGAGPQTPKPARNGVDLEALPALPIEWSWPPTGRLRAWVGPRSAG